MIFTWTSTDSNECKPSWEINILSAVQQICHHLWNRKFHCVVQNRTIHLPPHHQLQLPTLILRALTHFTFWASTLILSSRLDLCLPNDIVTSGFRPELFSINTSKVFRHAQNDLLQRWLVSTYFGAIIKRPKPAIFVINYVVRDWTDVDTFHPSPTVVPCILMSSKSFIYQLMHNRAGLKEY